MAGARNYKYEYETSPRKLKPDYTPQKKTTKKKKSTVNVKKLKKQEQEKLQKEKNRKFKLTIYVCIVFAVLFAISYRYSLINEQFNSVQKLKKELSTIQKDNEKLEVEIDNKLNLSSIEQSAKEKLGMQKLDSKQTVYVSLNKKDYVEPAAQQVVINNEESTFSKIVKQLKGFLE